MIFDYLVAIIEKIEMITGKNQFKSFYLQHTNHSFCLNIHSFSDRAIFLNIFALCLESLKN